MRDFLPVALAMALFGASATAQTPTCDALKGRDRARAESLLASEHLYDCCDGTVADCLAVRPPCSLAPRLAENICRRVAAGQDDVRIRRSLSRRARSMVGGGTPTEIDLTDAPTVGDPEAPVTVVVYACARCPYCSRLVPALHDEVTTGPLQGKARLVFRTFPIRGHEGSTEAGLAFVAAHRLGRFWPFLIHAYRHFDEFSADAQPDWAAAVGIDREAFVAGIGDPATREVLVASKKEGLVNRVEETPTVFINGRRWVGDLETVEIVDAIGEESDRARGLLWTR